MRNIKKYFSVILILSFLSAASGCKKHNDEKEIRIGGLFDLTGITNEAGNYYVDGIKGYIDFVNRQGGIHGKKVKLIPIDTAYVLQRDLAAYDLLVKNEKVHLIIGWSTGSSIALAPKTTRDKIPFTGVSFSKILADPAQAPYNFIMGPTYSDQMIILLKHIRSQWKNENARPKVAFLYNDKEFGKSPIEDGRAFAQKNNIEIVAEEIINIDAREAVEQLKRIKKAKADFAIINETEWATAVILRDARKMGLRTQFMGLVFSSDEKVLLRNKKDAEGYIGIFPLLFSEKDARGVEKILKNGNIQSDAMNKLTSRYINGWIVTQIMLEGVKRAGGSLAGEDIKNGLESIQNFDTEGISSPISFTQENHCALHKAKLCKVVNGEWLIISDYISAEE